MSVTEEKAKYKVVVQKPPAAFTRIYEAARQMEREALDPIGAEIVAVEASSEEEFIEAARDADAIIGGGRRITRNVIQSLQKCRIISGGGVGFDYVDVEAATEHGIVVTNVPDVFIEEVADHTMTLLLACWRRLTLQDRIVRTSRWGEGRLMLSQIPRLRGQTLGFVSFGNIPRLVSRRAKPFGFRILAYDPYIHETVMGDYDVEPVTDLLELLEQADFVSMHVPFSPGTHHMFGEEQFRSMKPTAVFINTGRGSTVDEQALVKALREGWIAFAGLDVFEKEPVDADNPLLQMDNVIVTAHVASASSRMMPEARRRVGREIAQVLQGRRPMSPVNPQVVARLGLR